MTQNEIANILDVSPATVSKYESGALEPNIESLKRLANEAWRDTNFSS